MFVPFEYTNFCHILPPYAHNYLLINCTQFYGKQSTQKAHFEQIFLNLSINIYFLIR